MNYQIPKNQLEDNLSKYYDYISVDHDLILFKDLAYKISFSGSENQENKNKNPVKFIETFIFQFLNPKAVIASIIVVSTYIAPGENFINYTTQIIILALLVSVTSITLWTFLGKFLRKFATNDKFINYFNYAMSLLLLLSIITFYL